MTVFLVFFLIVLLCFLWRLLPLLKTPHAGCDAYYYLLCTEEFSKSKKVPIILPPYYVLEYQEQWYPPGFSVFLSFIPNKILQRLYWCISPALDSLLCAGVFFFIFFYMERIDSAILGSFVYILSPSAISETQSLTSRQLGSLFFSITVVSGMFYVVNGNLYLLFLAIIFGVLLLLTHKFSAQTLYFSFILMSCVSLSVDYLIILFLIIVITILISKGYYLKILRSHIDYIFFWSKKWSYLGAHQIFDSPVYKKNISHDNVIYKKSIISKLKFLKTYFEENIYLTACLMTLFILLLKNDITIEYINFTFLTVIILGIGVISYFIPILRGIGFASQYGKLALPIGAICTGYILHISPLNYIVILILAHSLYRGAGYLQSILLDSGNKSHFFKWNIEELKDTIQYIRSLSNPIIMCIPYNYCDLIVYHCHKKVLWGTHGSPTKLFEDIYPVLFERIENIVKKYGVTHLLIDKRYVKPSDLNISAKPRWKNNFIVIYETGNGSSL